MNFDIDSPEWHQKYIHPYYGALMNLNFLNNTLYENPENLLVQLKGLRGSLSNDEILKLLNGPWRLSKVGAWLIGVCEIREHEDNLVATLKKTSIYCEHIIIIICYLNFKNGNSAIADYANKIISNSINHTKKGHTSWWKAIDEIQRRSLIWAFEGIQYLDDQNNTFEFNKIINSTNWSHLKEQWRSISEKSDREIRVYKYLIAMEDREKDRIVRSIEIIKIAADS